MSKNTLNWFDQNNPQREAVAKFRKPENIHAEEVLQDFLDYVQDEFFEDDKEGFSDLESLVQSFLGWDQKKVEQGEQELLTRWIEATKGS